MNHYRRFIFESYEFNPPQKSLHLYYNYDGELQLCETYHFPFDFVDYDPLVLDRAVQQLFFLAGVSYFKAYLSPEIIVQKGSVDETLQSFLNKTYQRGLGEFFFVNRLDPKTDIRFPVTSNPLPLVDASSTSGLLIGIGGGKDSLVSVELLRNQPKVATWSLSHHSQLKPLIERIGLAHFWVQRQWDRQLITLNKQGAYNGHVPISAIIGAVGTIVAILTGYSDVVVSNENSANEPTLEYEGAAINHQYSKSIEYETDYQQLLRHTFGPDLRYYSFLRPLSELRIAELFASVGMDKYHDVFSSCNRAYTHDQEHMFWCGECPKCAFVFLALTPFVERTKLESLFGGKNLLLTPALEPIYRQLLGIAGDKPLECVGEIAENRAIMQRAQRIYPELNKYQFELPSSYDYRTLHPHRMPDELYQLLVESLE